MKRFIVVTTIHPKSEGISVFENQADWQMVVVGDKKSVPIPSSANLTFLAVDEQLKMDFRLARQCPFDHYARKNIGYLHAIRSGADVIFDTDDDNIPYPTWKLPVFACDHEAVADSEYVNIFSHFTHEFVWPRGFPLDEIQNANQNHFRLSKTPAVKIGVWQGLTDDEPDVDVIFRLLFNKNIRFSRKTAFYLPKGRYCPVNSQNSFWNRPAFPYLYLPATVSFRFSDILRGYIAQRLLWLEEMHVGVTRATMSQRRNAHDIMEDFKDEIPIFISIKKIVAIIDSVSLGTDPFDNLLAIYERLVAARFVGREEMELLIQWQEAFAQIVRK
jgi:hypothetical protein